MTRGSLVATLVLRIFALGLLTASVAILATNKFTDPVDGSKTSFKDIHAYRYVIAVTFLGFVYTLIQMPFAIYHVAKEKRMIRNGCLPEFDFYADKMIAFILATAVGAGFAVGFEFKRMVDEFDASFAGGAGGPSDSAKFFNKGNISTGILLLGFLCVAVQSVISSISRNTTTSRGFFGGNN